MAELKTAQTNASVGAFLRAIPDARRRADCRVVARMMREATGERPRMWGTSIVGYGSYRYRYASGREGSWFLCGYSPRAQSLVVYIMPGFSEFAPLMKRLGRYRTGKSCLYLKSLDDVDPGVLQGLIAESVESMRRRYPKGRTGDSR